MNSPASASLRDLYTTHPSSWSFAPPPQNGSLSTAPPAPVAEPAYQWSVDLSPNLSLQPASPNASIFLKTLLAGAVLRYTSTAVAMPWEVGRTLLQVQYIPRTAATISDTQEISSEDVDEPSDESSGENDDAYFADAQAVSVEPFRKPRQTDERGYVVRQNVYESSTRPDYIIPVGSADGVWAMIKRVGRWKPEGWLALYKGQLTSCVVDFLSATFEPIVHSLLSSFISLVFPSFHSFFNAPQHSLVLPITSHVLTGLLLSPLDLVRTRLIVQSSVARHKHYSGPLDALSQIIRDEGGVRALYLHPQLLYPALLDCTLRPLAGLLIPAAAVHMLGPHAEDTHPLLYGLAQLAGECAALLVTLPVETVRRRLQAQTRGVAPPLRGCVELRPKPYYGVVDTLYSILSEERSDLPLKPRRVRRLSKSVKGKTKDGVEDVSASEAEGNWLRNTGIGQLYRGMGMRVGANVIVFILRTFSGIQDVDNGWTEL